MKSTAVQCTFVCLLLAGIIHDTSGKSRSRIRFRGQRHHDQEDERHLQDSEDSWYYYGLNSTNITNYREYNNASATKTIRGDLTTIITKCVKVGSEYRCDQVGTNATEAVVDTNATYTGVEDSNATSVGTGIVEDTNVTSAESVKESNSDGNSDGNSSGNSGGNSGAPDPALSKEGVKISGKHDKAKDGHAKHSKGGPPKGDRRIRQ